MILAKTSSCEAKMVINIIKWQKLYANHCLNMGLTSKAKLMSSVTSSVKLLQGHRFFIEKYTKLMKMRF